MSPLLCMSLFNCMWRLEVVKIAAMLEYSTPCYVILDSFCMAVGKCVLLKSACCKMSLMVHGPTCMVKGTLG